MYISLKRVLLSNGVIVICSIIIGYSLWLMLSRNQLIQHTISIPVHIQTNEGLSLGQAQIEALIEGSRTNLRAIVQRPPSVLININPQERQSVTIQPHDIKLPQTITLLEYKPTHLSV